jgi:hypothetical protein
MRSSDFAGMVAPCAPETRVADRNARAMSVIAMNSEGHG